MQLNKVDTVLIGLEALALCGLLALKWFTRKSGAVA